VDGRAEVHEEVGGDYTCLVMGDGTGVSGLINELCFQTQNLTFLEELLLGSTKSL
jgi:hypothetical protein